MAEPVIYATGEQFTISLKAANTCKAGDLLGYSSGWVKADADSSPPIPAIFIALQTQPDTGGTVRVARKALLYDTDSPYTIDAQQFLSGTAGAHTETAPTGSNPYLQAVGRALSTDHALLDLDEHLSLVTLAFPIDLANLSATGDVVTTMTPGFRGRIKKVYWVQGKAGAGAGASLTLNLEVGTVNLTGGVVTLTLATATPMGKVIAGTDVTANNTFGPTDTLSLEAVVTTAFTDGSGTLYVEVLASI